MQRIAPRDVPIDVVECDLFGASDLHAGTMLDGLHEGARLVKGVMSARIQPGEAAAQPGDSQITAFHVGDVDVGDLEFAAGRGLHLGGNIDDVLIVEIETGDCPVRLWSRGAFPRCW